jgi:hypothetical protein
MAENNFRSDRGRDPIAELARLIGQADPHGENAAANDAFREAAPRTAVMDRPSFHLRTSCRVIRMRLSRRTSRMSIPTTTKRTSRPMTSPTPRTITTRMKLRAPAGGVAWSW